MALFQTSRHRDLLACSFCGKGSDEVRAMVAGSGVRICDECVSLAGEIIRERAGGEVHPRFRRDRPLREQSSGWLIPWEIEDSAEVDFVPEGRLDVDDDTGDQRPSGPFGRR